MRNWNVRKIVVPPEAMPEEHRLKKTLSWHHLIFLGVGAIVGTGILVLIGTAADKAGPAMMLSFVIAGVICAAAALAYAEVATMIPASGSAYTYSYVVFGELIAWFVGWSLILEYSLVVSAVSVGWSGYFSPLIGIPQELATAPLLGGVFNFPAVFIIAVIAGMLIYGMRESATLNSILVAIKMLALAMFIVVALRVFQADNFTPFMPYGFVKSGPSGQEVGVMAAAAIIFFAFYGFDAIATAAEETKNPGRDLAIGIVGSMVLCVLIYMAVAAAAIGAEPYQRFVDSPEPLALILRDIGQPVAAKLLALSASVGLPTVILAFFYGQSRIFLAMSRDGLLPAPLARLSGRRNPVRITLFTAVVVGALAGLVPLNDLVALANAGTLTAFIAVCAAMLTLRRRDPDAKRLFRTPLPWVTGLIGILGCAYLFYSLPRYTQEWFLIWNAVGLVIYFVFASGNAERTRGKAAS
ncbi:amino acid permease [Sphingomonas sp. RG327]|jgi:APA family basic amino acid/polyamine antiporter|uniref:Amino acid permease n=1 Tax=Sphingomonas anseongensis TaxID=2908207 RepID=A0ABT0RDI8_9SPHN|nr:amino acid permease [Sphingomonas anseongensis]MCL6678313.1 amino acid permease [Sphingomonas anseongensis]